MGAASCAAAKHSEAGCCSSGDNAVGSGNMPEVEYRPASKAQDASEILEPVPAKTVSAQDADQSSADNRRPAEITTDQPDESAGEGYFVLELPELRRMPSMGPNGYRPVHTFKSGATYLGQWKGNMRHGFGAQTWPDGASFTGNWDNSNANGLGRFVHADGDVFVGEWTNNAAQGLGVYYHKHGLMTYVGQWIEDLQHGYGRERWQNGSNYSGQFQEGKKHGHGVYEWPDGSKYFGNWVSNSATGYGHYIGKDGREFHGMWKDSLIHGSGKYTWPDGRSYQGQYEQDMKHGYGVFTWEDGRCVQGFWYRSKQHGHGKLFSKTGELVKEGFWNMGREPTEGGNNGTVV